MTIQELAEKMMEAQRLSRAKKHRKENAPQSTTASSLGYHCERRQVYARVNPRDAEPYSEELCSIFEEGDMHQSDVRRELIELGFEALEAERYFKDQTLEVAGKIDGMLKLDAEHRGQSVPVEIKSCTGNPPTTAEGLRNHDGIYGRYFAQLQIYMFLTNSPQGMFLFKDKITGLWTCVPCDLDYEYAGELVKRAERVRDAIRLINGAPKEDRDLLYPPRIADRSECGGCPWRDTICHPAEAAVDPMLLVADTKLLSEVEERERLASMASRYEYLDESLKTRFKTTKGDRFIVGDERGFLVTKKPHGKGIRVDFRRLSEAG